MGCGATKPQEENYDTPVPEGDVDLASVKDFDQEQREAALRVPRDPSASTHATRSSYSYRSETLAKPIEPTDQISLQSVQGELPPLAPPRRSKDQLVPHPSVFRHTDRLVSNIPSSATSSVTTLAFYLTSSCPTDLHYVRAVFCWLALNIIYDSESYAEGTSRPQDPGFVLMCRKAVCVGFTRFFEVLCNLADIPCLTVEGIAKGYSHDPEAIYSADSGVNHAWNLVLLEGEWRPLDCTCGAGYLHEDGSFRRELNDHWFLTDPEEFLPTHFPYMYRDLAASRVYQLVHRTVDLAHFSSLVRRDNLAYRVGLELVTHQRSVISDVRRDVTVKIKATKHRMRAVTAYLTDRSDKHPKKDRSGILTSWEDDDTCNIYVRPPRAATYLLTIMGQAEDQEETTLQRLCVYAVRCVQTETNQFRFPEVTGSWGLQNPMATECGLKQVKGTTFTFTAKDGAVTVPIGLLRHTELAVRLRHAEAPDEDLARYTLVEYGEEMVDIRARLPRAGNFLLRVFASHPQLRGMQHAADFLLLLRADAPCQKDCLPFPRSSDFAHVNRTRLLQPLVREVSRGTASLFRVQAPRLARLCVDGRKMERGSDGVWEAEVTPEHDGKTVLISGSAQRGATYLSGLYTFDVV